MVLLYSSDYYESYKQDILAINSLPEGYLYHFRYDDKRISPYIQNNYSRITGCESLIVYVQNNSKSNHNLNFLPIRKAIIDSISKDQNTNLFHVYFKLGPFVNLTQDFSSIDEKPQNIYLGWQIIQPELKITSWDDKVGQLNKLCPGLHFHVELLQQRQNGFKEQTVCNEYDGNLKESFFKLTEGIQYTVKLSIFDDKPKAQSKISTKFIDTDYISTSLSETINSSLRSDNLFYRISGKLLGEMPFLFTRISMRSYDPNGNIFYPIKLSFKIIKDKSRFWVYFWTTGILVLGAGLLATDLSEPPVEISLPYLILLKAIGLLIVSLSTASLFYRFNKK